MRKKRKLEKEATPEDKNPTRNQIKPDEAEPSIGNKTKEPC